MTNELLNAYFRISAKYAHKLINLNRDYILRFHWIKEHIIDYLPPNRKTTKILVLGSGLGHEVWALNKIGYSNVLGIDIDKEQVKIAKSMGVNCICDDALEFLAKTQERYDAILAFNFIEHFDLDDALKLCKLCYSRLSNNGALIITTPNAANPLTARNIYGDLTHKIGAFTETSIVQLLKASGFNKIIVRNVMPFSCYDFSITRRLQKSVGVIIIYILWQLIRLLYVINGVNAPRVVSSDLLAIGYKLS